MISVLAQATQHMRITLDKLPSSFINEIVEATPETLVVIRSSVASISDVNQWVVEFGESTKTQWNARKSRPNGERIVCSKKFVCYHSSFMKVPREENKTGSSRNFECPASITVRVKLNTKVTKRRDPFVQHLTLDSLRPVWDIRFSILAHCRQMLLTTVLDPFIQRGLFGIIHIYNAHNHSLDSHETLRCHPAVECDDKFVEYFNNGPETSESTTSISDLQIDNILDSNYSSNDFQLQQSNITENNHSFQLKEHIIMDQTLNIFQLQQNNALQNYGLDSVIDALKDCDKKFGSSFNSLKKITDVLKNIDSSAQWDEFLNAAGNSIPLFENDSMLIQMPPIVIAKSLTNEVGQSKQVTIENQPRFRKILPKENVS